MGQFKTYLEKNNKLDESKMTPSKLKSYVEDTGSLYFSKNNMKFFGDTMSNYGVKETVIDTRNAKNLPVYELFRKKPVKNGRKDSVYFDKKTFKKVLKL